MRFRSPEETRVYAQFVRQAGRRPDASHVVHRPSDETKSKISADMRTLPDYLRRGMKLIIVGCNPSDRSTRLGHHYAGRNNLFWPLLYKSGILPEEITYRDDKRVIEFGVGLTDLVKRSTRSMDEIERHEYAEGRILLARKLEEFTPRVVAFNGKQAYERFAQRACKLGLQEGKLYGAQVFVLPSTSDLNVGGNGVKLRYSRQLAAQLAVAGSFMAFCAPHLAGTNMLTRRLQISDAEDG